MSFSKSKFFKEVSSKDINRRNEEGETILHQAVEISYYKTIRLLIKKGAEVNARDKNGYTPLHCAVFAKSLENVKVLLRSGAEVNGLCCIATYERLTIVRIISNLLKILFFCNQSDQI